MKVTNLCMVFTTIEVFAHCTQISLSISTSVLVKTSLSFPLNCAGASDHDDYVQLISRHLWLRQQLQRRVFIFPSSPSPFPCYLVPLRASVGQHRDAANWNTEILGASTNHKTFLQERCLWDLRGYSIVAPLCLCLLILSLHLHTHTFTLAYSIYAHSKLEEYNVHNLIGSKRVKLG
jgi:hypothetical protein